MPVAPVLALLGSLLLQPTGGGVQRLVESPFTLSRPVVSPDGSRVAYVEEGEFGSTVAVARLADGLPVAEGAGSKSILGEPLWLDDGVWVGWLEKSGRWWRMSCEGEIDSRELPRPARPLGAVLWRGARRLIVYAEREVVLYGPDGSGRPEPTPLATANSSITGIVPVDDAGVLIVDGGGVYLWNADKGRRPLAMPSADAAEYVAARALAGGRVLLTSRRRGMEAPDRLSVLAPASGQETEIALLDGLGAVAPVDPECGRLIAEAAQSLRLFVLGMPSWIPLTTKETVDRFPAVTPDGRAVVFSSSGRDDTNRDGAVSRSDPPNLYVLTLP